MYDIIVIGARVAGAPTAMLLARKGYKVLLVDRASFPSDTLSTHQIQLRGVAALKRWGLLDQVIDSNCPPIGKGMFCINNLVLRGEFPPLDGVSTVVCPRRTILDALLVNAAIQSGVEMREDFLVERLLFEGDKVTGIAGRSKSKPDTTDKCIEESARLIIGADGKHSLVAREVKAQEYDSKSVLSCAYYCYWEGISISSLELYNIPHASIGICPTNDGLTMIYIAYPISQFPEVRKDIEGSFWKTIDSVPSLAERVHSGRLSERFYGTADLPSFYRQSRGPGWSLVGDAGMSMDPVTGQGIGNAFRDAERMSESIDEAFGGKKSLEKALREYEDARKYETIAMYEFTSQIASFADPTVEQQEFFSGLARRPELANRFLGALTGSVSIRYLFSPVSLLQIMGIRGVGRVLLSKLIPPRSVPDQFS